MGGCCSANTFDVPQRPVNGDIVDGWENKSDWLIFKIDLYQNGKFVVSHLVRGSWISVVLFDDTVDPLKIGFGLSIFSFRLSAQRKFVLSIITFELNS